MMLHGNHYRPQPVAARRAFFAYHANTPLLAFGRTGLAQAFPEWGGVLPHV